MFRELFTIAKESVGYVYKRAQLATRLRPPELDAEHKRRRGSLGLHPREPRRNLDPIRGAKVK